MKANQRSQIIGHIAVFAIGITAFINVGCTRSNALPSLTAPSATLVQSPPPEAASSIFTLRGRVTEPVPTSLTGVAALITVIDGADAGKSTVASPMGYYSLPGLRAGEITLKLTAEGYVGASQVVRVTADATANLQMQLLPATQTHTLRGQIAPGDGTCSDSISDKPCRIVVIPIHNAGQIDATLSWSPQATANLDLTLFQTGVDVPIARSAGAGSGPERVVANLTVGATYELRITYAAGTTDTSYTLTVVHQN